MRFIDDPNTDATDPERDIPNQRYVHTKYGFSIKLERRDPFGFAYVVWPSGPTPQVLSGAYTEFDKARQAVELYVNNMTGNKVVEELPVYEKAQVKKRFKKNAEDTGEESSSTAA